MKSKNYNKFWQQIHNSAKNKGFPLRVMFELTYRCNFFCRHCYVPLHYRKYKELKTKEIFSILEQLKDIGCFYLGFTGGEPFVRKDIFKILHHAKKLGFEIIIYTNGSLIDRKSADELALISPNKIDITIPAMTEIAFGQIIGANGYRDKVFKAIELLHKRKIALGFKTCILKENKSQITDIHNFVESLGAKHHLDYMLSHCLDGSKEPYKYKVSALSTDVENQDEYGSTGKVGCENNKSKQSSSLFYCGVGKSQAAITPFGELKLCVMIDYPKYKILDSSLKDCWQRLKRSVDNIKPDQNYQCDTCELNDFCHWCPARSWLENKDFVSCEPICRQHALAQMKIYKKQNSVSAKLTFAEVD
ncbi:MAG: radical SAM protein [Candidatus Omnitrophica bacterium]|nr:radical SAM protein [Candidatus Omnitrophota bacterium]